MQQSSRTELSSRGSHLFCVIRTMLRSLLRLPVLSVATMAVLCLPPSAQADTAYGSLNNFDTINDTSNRCYGFEIELEDIHSRDITYTYDWNHYGAPRIFEDSTDPLHPRVFVRYESKKNPDGSYASFTNPQDPLHPLGPTDGHAFTNPSLNLGGEHFGLGFVRSPSLVKYHWLVDDPQNPGNLILGPVVTISTPSFNYVPPPAPAMPAQLQVVMEPVPPEVPEIENVEQFGTPVWVKAFKTVQPSGRHIDLDELVGEPIDPNDRNWEGEEDLPETEIEWMVFQKRPLSNPGEDEIEAADELPEGDETVTRRYEFYTYNGPVNEEDGEAQCDHPDNCEGAVGNYIGSQMAGFNVEEPLGLIDHLQDGERDVAYVERSIVVGGNTPYVTTLTAGALPEGLLLDASTGLLSGTPTVGGQFDFTVNTVDADAATTSRTYRVNIAVALTITTVALPDATENAAYAATLTADGGTPPYTWGASDLPQGLILNEDGTLTGSPALGTAGSYGVTFAAIDSLQNSASQTLPLVIEAAPAVRGDVDGDKDVDRGDLALVMAARNLVVAPGDPRDLDASGKVTVLDARILVTLFTRPGGAL